MGGFDKADPVTLDAGKSAATTSSQAVGKVSLSLQQAQLSTQESTCASAGYTVKQSIPDFTNTFEKSWADTFAIDVKLPDGREVRVDGMQYETSCLAAKEAVFEKAGLDMNLLDQYVLVFYEQYMDENFNVNYFGMPWNGTDCELCLKTDRNRLW